MKRFGLLSACMALPATAYAHGSSTAYTMLWVAILLPVILATIIVPKGGERATWFLGGLVYVLLSAFLISPVMTEAFGVIGFFIFPWLLVLFAIVARRKAGRKK